MKLKVRPTKRMFNPVYKNMTRGSINKREVYFMSWLKNFLTTSLGKKYVMGLTGLLLCGFLFSHVVGNFLLFVGDYAYNAYAHALMSTPLIYVAEVILLSVFLLHFFYGVGLTLQNKSARGTNYVMNKTKGKKNSFAYSSMPITGIIILIFVVVHLINFKYGNLYYKEYEGVRMRDLYTLVIELFRDPLYVVYYVASVVAVGIHISHGFSSAFQSLGLNHSKYTPFLEKFSLLYSIFITVGFSILPIWAYFKGANL